MAISLPLSSGERIPPLPPLPWRERVGVRGQEVGGPNMIDSMPGTLFIIKGKEDVNWGGLSLYVESRHVLHERTQFHS